MITGLPGLLILQILGVVKISFAILSPLTIFSFSVLFLFNQSIVIGAMAYWLRC